MSPDTGGPAAPQAPVPAETGGVDAGSGNPAAPQPLLAPRDGVSAPLTDRRELAELARALSHDPLPVALDAERASGYRYSQRAYLVQLRRADVGTALLDPVALGDLTPLDEPLASSEWVLHAATQDLPCLADLGLRPRSLFDTELGGRLAGLPRVGLAPMLEDLLGIQLRKGHGADDWSVRPLPPDWLSYAALDVELLVDLRDAVDKLLRQQGKQDWARQEFAAIAAARPATPRPDPWRRTSGINKVTDRRALAIIREMWMARDLIASQRDIAPHRVLPDTAIVAAATAVPTTAAALTALPVFSGRHQRRQAPRWLAAIDRARALPVSDLPPVRLTVDGPPPASRWAAKDPDAAARLNAARTALTELSERVHIPVENLLSPRTARAVLWQPPEPADIQAALAERGARAWQIELTEPLLRAAIG